MSRATKQQQTAFVPDLDPEPEVSETPATPASNGEPATVRVPTRRSLSAELQAMVKLERTLLDLEPDPRQRALTWLQGRFGLCAPTGGTQP